MSVRTPDRHMRIHVPQSSAEVGKHRRPGKHRRQARTAHPPGAPALMGTAVLASAAAAFLHVPAASGSDTPTARTTSLDPVKSVRAGSASLLAQAAAAAHAGQIATVYATPDADVAAKQAAMLRTLRSGSRASRSISAHQRTITLKKLEATVAWVKPVVSYTLTAGFGDASSLWAHRHTGQDFAAPTGTPIHVVGAGTVVFAQWDGAYGRKIIVRHGDGTETWYCHMSAFEAKLGDTVQANDVIGLVGATGNTTGPHLHFEVRPEGGDPIEPMAWLRDHGVAV